MKYNIINVGVAWYATQEMEMHISGLHTMQPLQHIKEV